MKEIFLSIQRETFSRVKGRYHKKVLQTLTRLLYSQLPYLRLIPIFALTLMIFNLQLHGNGFKPQPSWVATGVGDTGKSHTEKRYSQRSEMPQFNPAMVLYWYFYRRCNSYILVQNVPTRCMYFHTYVSRKCSVENCANLKRQKYFKNTSGCKFCKYCTTPYFAIPGAKSRQFSYLR